MARTPYSRMIGGQTKQTSAARIEQGQRAASTENELLPRRLGSRVRKRRTERGWTFERLSRETKIQVAILEGIELRSRDASAGQIAAKLGVLFSELFAD